MALARRGPADRARADAYAERVQKVVGLEAKAGAYRWTATVAEAHLIRGNYDLAGRVYEAAAAIARKRLLRARLLGNRRAV